MKLRKDYWEINQLGSLCHITSGGTPSKAVEEYWLNGTIPWLRSECCKNELIQSADVYISEKGFKNSSAKLFKANTTLIALVGATIGKTAFVTFEATTNQNVSGLYPLDETNLYPQFLFYSCQAFYYKNFSRYTGFKMANLAFIKSLEIFIPPLEEQKQIAALFQSIETTIAQIEEQEGRLNGLQKTLSNSLASEAPVFGNLLSTSPCTTTTFGAVAACIEKHDKQKEATRFVGLENIEPEAFNITTWGIEKDSTTFTKTFLQGDVLFGKRRSYLKKVAVAPFNGICSGDILVLRANETVLLPALLPFYVLSEPFINHAVNTSAGSLSPRTKWKDLASFKVAIPDLETQEKIAAVLTQLLKTREALQTQKHTLKKLKHKLLNEILG